MLQQSNFTIGCRELKDAVGTWHENAAARRLVRAALLDHGIWMRKINLLPLLIFGIFRSLVTRRFQGYLPSSPSSPSPSLGDVGLWDGM